MISTSQSATFQAAAEFRLALLTLDRPQLYGLTRFPVGACGDASRLLAQFLRDEGLGDWAIVSGEKGDPHRTHAWLRLEGRILDITASQFDDVADDVVLVEQSGWHDSWNARIAQETGVGLSYYSEESGARLDYAEAVRTVTRHRGQADG